MQSGAFAMLIGRNPVVNSFPFRTAKPCLFRLDGGKMVVVGGSSILWRVKIVEVGQHQRL